MGTGINHLAEFAEVVDCIPYTAAGSTDATGNAIDMNDAMGCLFIASMGTITDTSVGGLQIQQSDDDSTYTDITAAVQLYATTGDSDKMIIVDVRRPGFTSRYLRAVLERATANAVINSVIALKYNQNVASVTQADNASTTVVGTVKV